VNKYSHIISSGRREQRTSRPTGDTAAPPALRLGVLWDPRSVMWITRGIPKADGNQCIKMSVSATGLSQGEAQVQRKPGWTIAANK